MNCVNCTETTFVIILYVLGCILLIALIFFVVRLIGTLSKLDKVLDDVSQKSAKLDGVFNLVDKSADAINSISDTAVSFITGTVLGFMNKKKNKGDDIDE